MTQIKQWKHFSISPCSEYHNRQSIVKISSVKFDFIWALWLLRKWVSNLQNNSNVWYSNENHQNTAIRISNTYLYQLLWFQEVHQTVTSCGTAMDSNNLSNNYLVSSIGLASGSHFVVWRLTNVVAWMSIAFCWFSANFYEHVEACSEQ